MYVKKAAEKTYVQKIRAYNDDEIDTSSLDKERNMFGIRFAEIENALSLDPLNRSRL
jgi:hypothetical protein